MVPSAALSFLSPLLLLGGLLLLLSACGGSKNASDFETACAAIPECAESLVQTSVPRETIWRVELIRSAAGDVTIGQVEPVEVEQGRGVPVSRLSGTHMLAGLDAAGEAVESYLVSFPETLRFESGGESAMTREVDLTGREVDAYGYLRAVPGIVKLAVRDPSGNEITTAALPRRTADLRRSPLSGNPLLSAALAPAVVAPPRPELDPVDRIPLPPHCSHLFILGGEQHRDRARGISYEKEVVLMRPDPMQRAVIQASLNMMTPLLCHGVSRIALGNVPDDRGTGGVVMLSTGDMMLINIAAGYHEVQLAASEESRLNMMHTILHEAAHTAEHLLNVESSRPAHFGGWWSGSQRSLARATIGHVRLEKSLAAEWMRIHSSFVRHDWASPYSRNAREREQIRDRNAEQVANAGFISRYGGTGYADDIADMVAWTYLGQYYRAAGIPEERGRTQDFGCQEMRRYQGKELPARFAALFTKLMFIRDLGLVREEDVSHCLGSVALPVDRPGFHSWRDGNPSRSYDRDLSARIGTLPNGRYVYEMKGSGTAKFGNDSYPATVRLMLGLDSAGTTVDQVSWPRGVYELALGGTNSFQLRLEGGKAGNFDVYDGYALVAEASNDRIAGSVFIRKVMRLEAPLPVPEVFDPPMIVRFLIAK
jgi:hypothetical protein